MLDLLIIGGGITGAGILWEGTRRGLKCALVEMHEPSSQTTGISSGLIHGGLRYLPYDFPNTLLCCQEAAQVRRLAPQLLKRQIFLWPSYSHQWTKPDLIETVLESYDKVSMIKGGLPHVRLSKDETLKIESKLNKNHLLGSLTFDEWSVDPKKLVDFLLNEAVQLGGQYNVHSKAVRLIKNNNIVEGAEIQSRNSSSKEIVSAKIIINATGPWAQKTAEMAGSRAVELILRKGTHLIISRQGIRHAVLFQDSSKRFIGAYPKNNELWIGPTDDPFEGRPEDCRIEGEEMLRLSAAAKNIFPDLDVSQGRYITGVRPILKQHGSAGLLTRDYRIFDHDAIEGIGHLITAAGGKMTIFKKMAQETLDLAQTKLSSTPSATQLTSSKNLNLSKKTALLYSLVRLAYFTARHFLVRIWGAKRSGVRIFYATYGDAS